MKPLGESRFDLDARYWIRMFHSYCIQLPKINAEAFTIVSWFAGKITVETIVAAVQWEYD